MRDEAAQYCLGVQAELILCALCQVGQATTIHHWVYEDGTEGGPAAFVAEESTERPTVEEVQTAGVQPPTCTLLTVSAVQPIALGQEMP